MSWHWLNELICLSQHFLRKPWVRDLYLFKNPTFRLRSRQLLPTTTLRSTPAIVGSMTELSFRSSIWNRKTDRWEWDQKKLNNDLVLLYSHYDLFFTKKIFPGADQDSCQCSSTQHRRAARIQSKSANSLLTVLSHGAYHFGVLFCTLLGFHLPIQGGGAHWGGQAD